MPRPAKNGRYTHEAAQKMADWYSSSDASTEFIADWDLKTDLLAEFVLTGLSLGYGVMFGVVGNGALASVTLFEGDNKRRKWVRDSIELEDAMMAALNQWRSRAKAVQEVDKGEVK